ncbi:DNA primase [Mesorhizobium atlanticum]
MSFPEAVEKIAEMAGVPMPVRDEREERREKERASLTDVMEMATAFFQERLQSADGAKARAYLRERGLTSATQQSFPAGLRARQPQCLERASRRQRACRRPISRLAAWQCGTATTFRSPMTGFAIASCFRSRISRGKIIAFGGRALAPDALAKYMNSPETELFHKGNVLYNFARARKALAKGGTVIAVEGYMDVIALAQAGFENAVAPLGTALTENQLELLWRMAPEPVLCFDGDKAGLKAAWRAADLALPSVQAGRSGTVCAAP